MWTKETVREGCEEEDRVEIADDGEDCIKKGDEIKQRLKWRTSWRRLAKRGNVRERMKREEARGGGTVYMWRPSWCSEALKVLLEGMVLEEWDADDVRIKKRIFLIRKEKRRMTQIWSCKQMHRLCVCMFFFVCERVCAIDACFRKQICLILENRGSHKIQRTLGTEYRPAASSGPHQDKRYI